MHDVCRHRVAWCQGSRMSEIGTGLQNAVGHPRRASHGRAMPSSKPPTCATCSRRSASWPTGPVRRQLERSRARFLHGRWRALSPAPPRASSAGARSRPASPPAASAALSGARLQPAERRRRTLVRAGHRRHRRRPPACAPSSCLPGTLRRRGADARRGTSRSTSSGSRRAPASRATDAGGPPSRRRRLRARAARAAPQHRERHDNDARPDGAPLGSFTLTDPFDAALVDDARVDHGVTAVEA